MFRGWGRKKWRTKVNIFLYLSVAARKMSALAAEVVENGIFAWKQIHTRSQVMQKKKKNSLRTKKNPSVNIDFLW